MSPCRRLVDERCFSFLFFSPDNWPFLFWIQNWALRNPKMSAKKKTFWAPFSLTGRQGLVQHVCKISGSLEKTSWKFGLLCVRETRVICVVALQSLSFSMASTLGLKILLEIGLAQSDLRIFARNVFPTCLAAPGTGSFRQKMANIALFLWKYVTVFDHFERPWSVGAYFRL